MDRTQFINHIKATYQRCLQVLADKNQDYGKDDDPWANFKFAAIANIDVADAIMVRILDKMARISNLLHKEAVVKDETVTDTIEDAINYLGILLAWIQHDTPEWDEEKCKEEWGSPNAGIPEPVFGMFDEEKK